MFLPSLDVARRRLIWHLAAAIVAGRGLVTPRVCGRWLLVWLFNWLLDLATRYHYCRAHGAALGAERRRHIFGAGPRQGRRSVVRPGHPEFNRDLFHPIQGRAIAGRGPASPGTPFTCKDPGLMWPDVARRLPTLAPKLAPSKLISNANVLPLEQIADPAGTRAASSRTRADDHVGPIRRHITCGIAGTARLDSASDLTVRGP